MNGVPDYNVSMEETHHIHKKDSPSGTGDYPGRGNYRKYGPQERLGQRNLLQMMIK